MKEGDDLRMDVAIFLKACLARFEHTALRQLCDGKVTDADLVEQLVTIIEADRRRDPIREALVGYLKSLPGYERLARRTFGKPGPAINGIAERLAIRATPTGPAYEYWQPRPGY